LTQIEGIEPPILTGLRFDLFLGPKGVQKVGAWMKLRAILDSIGRTTGAGPV